MLAQCTATYDSYRWTAFTSCEVFMMVLYLVQEIELVISRLEEETSTAKEECERAAENRIKCVYLPVPLLLMYFTQACVCAH